jgi:hypothetical protein
MFRELLESNGIEVKWCLETHFNSHNIYSAEIECDTYYGMLHARKYTMNHRAIEQACMQYCIENGVKLEWLSIGIKVIYNKTKNLRQILSSTLLSDKDFKLIATIFAHDIKIIAT